MKKLLQQISYITKCYEANTPTIKVTYNSNDYLADDSLIISDSIIKSIAFEYSKLCLESLAIPLEESKSLQDTLYKRLSLVHDESTKDILVSDFNKYSIDGSMTYIEGYNCGINTKVLADTIKLVSQFSGSFSVYYAGNHGLLFYCDKDLNPIIVLTLYPVNTQSSLDF